MKTQYNRIIIYISIAIAITFGMFLLVSCSNSADHVDVYGRSSLIFDDTDFDLPKGYFLYDYDRVRIDEDHVDLVLHFSNDSINNDWK